LLARQRLAGQIASGGIADERSKVADQENNGVPKVLKMPQLSHQDCVSQMEIWRGGVETCFNAERSAGFAAVFEALAEVGNADNFCCALLEQVHLFING